LDLHPVHVERLERDGGVDGRPEVRRPVGLHGHRAQDGTVGAPGEQVRRQSTDGDVALDGIVEGQRGFSRRGSDEALDLLVRYNTADITNLETLAELACDRLSGYLRQDRGVCGWDSPESCAGRRWFPANPRGLSGVSSQGVLRMRTCSAAILAVLSLVVWGGCRPGQTPPRSTAAAQTSGRPAGVRAILQLGPRAAPHRYTDDGRHVLLLVQRGEVGLPAAYLDERLLTPTGSPSEAEFSPDGTRVAHIVLLDDGEHLYINENPQPKLGERMHGFRWSPDGEHLAYLVVRDERKWIVVDDKLVQPMPEGFTGLTWVPDSPLVYAFPDGDQTGQWMVTVEGRGPVFEAVSPPVAGKRNGGMAYAATADGQMRVVWNGRLQRPFLAIDPQSLTFSPDGTHLAYVVRSEGEARVVADGAPGEAFEEIVKGSLGFTGGGATVRYAAREGQRMYVVIGAERGPAHAYVGRLVGDPGGNHVAYVPATRTNSGQLSVMLDHSLVGEPQHPPGPGALTFSPDGNHFAYWGAERGQYGILVDGKRTVAEQGPPEHLTFSPDGERIAFAGGTAVVVDGKRQGPWKVVVGSPAFSADSRHVAYAVSEGSRQAVVVDGERGEWFDEMWVRQPRFDTDGSLEYVAVRDRTLYRVTWRPPEG